MYKEDVRNNKEIIKVSNSLVEAKYKLGLQEQKIYLNAISLINENEDKFNEINFNLTDFSQRSNTDIKHLYKNIESICMNLMKAVVQVKHDEEHWKMYSLISYCEYNKGNIKVKFDEEMKPFLLKLKKQYTKYLLSAIEFKNKYSIRIYQLLKMHSFKTPPEIIYDYDEFRELIGLESEKYQRFGDFRIYVLEKAKQEVSKKSDIFFKYEKIKSGKKVSGIKFYIYNKVKNIQNENDEIFEESVIKITNLMKEKAGLINAKFNNEQLLLLYDIACKKTDSEKINVFEYIKLNYIYMLETGSAINKFAYLKDCLENDYAKAVAQFELSYIV